MNPNKLIATCGPYKLWLTDDGRLLIEDTMENEIVFDSRETERRLSIVVDNQDAFTRNESDIKRRLKDVEDNQDTFAETEGDIKELFHKQEFQEKRQDEAWKGNATAHSEIMASIEKTASNMRTEYRRGFKEKGSWSDVEILKEKVRELERLVNSVSSHRMTNSNDIIELEERIEKLERYRDRMLANAAQDYNWDVFEEPQDYEQDVKESQGYWWCPDIAKRYEKHDPRVDINTCFVKDGVGIFHVEWQPEAPKEEPQDELPKCTKHGIVEPYCKECQDEPIAAPDDMEQYIGYLCEFRQGHPTEAWCFDRLVGITEYEYKYQAKRLGDFKECRPHPQTLRLKEAEAKIAELEHLRDRWEENKVQVAELETLIDPNNMAYVKRLEAERDELRKRIDKAIEKLEGPPSAGIISKVIEILTPTQEKTEEYSDGN